VRSNINIAIVGLGRVGSIFLKKLLEIGREDISIVAVAEKDSDSPMLKLAMERGIKVCDDHQIANMGKEVDIIFDMTGDSKSRRSMRMKMLKSGNIYTVIAPEIMAFLIWALIGEEGALPDVHSTKGY
jgi:predicted dinucleotide-utilizing enzyme